MLLWGDNLKPLALRTQMNHYVAESGFRVLNVRDIFHFLSIHSLQSQPLPVIKSWTWKAPALLFREMLTSKERKGAG